MRIDGLIQGQGFNLSNVMDVIRLNPGDVIRAQVLEIMANEVLLKLYDGTTLKASVLADIEVEKGQLTNFIVKDKIDNQLLLEQLKNNQSKNSSIQDMLIRQLLSIGMEADSQNLEIAEKMISNFIPFKKDIFDSVLKIIDQHKNLDAAKAVFLASNGLLPNEKNVEALNLLTDSRMQIGAEIEQLKYMLDKLGSNSEKATTPQIYNTLNNIAEDNESEILLLIDNELECNRYPGLNDLIKGFNLKGKIQMFVANTSKTPEVDIDKAINRLIKDMPAKLRPRERIALKDLMSSLTSKIKSSSNVKQSEIENSDLVKLEDIKKDLDKVFLKIDIRDSEKEFNIKEIYKSLYQKLDSIKESLGLSAFTGRDELLQKIDNLQNHIRFINDINNHNTYVQIPVNMFNKNYTGELYILKRESKRKKIDPGNTTMLIALNTQNIGRFELLIMVNNKNIALNIRVEDQKIINFLKESYKALYDGIIEKGYNLVDVRYRLVDQPLDVLNANDVVNKELSHNKVSVDIRI